MSSQSFTYKVKYIILYTVSSLAITGVASPSLTRLYTLYFIQSGVDSVKKYLPGGEWFSINWCGGGENEKFYIKRQVFNSFWYFSLKIHLFLFKNYLSSTIM